jgi:hypothetical protein
MEIVLSLISVAAAALAVHLMRSTAHGALLYELIRRQSEPRLRDDRARVYALASKPFASWTHDEYLCVERVATVLDQVGFLLKHRYVTMRAFMTWYSQVVLCYQIAKPLIDSRRHKEGVPVLFLHFEWLARKCHRTRKSKFWWERRSWDRLRDETATLPSAFELGRVISTRPPTAPALCVDGSAASPPPEFRKFRGTCPGGSWLLTLVPPGSSIHSGT